MKDKRIYDQLAESYDYRQSNPTAEIIRKREKELIEEYSSGKILDVGCGTGHHLQNLSNAVGLDISREMLKKAREKTDKNLLLSKAEELPLEDGSLDTVLCLHSTLNMLDWKTSIKEMSRVLRPGGKTIITAASVYDNRSFWDKLTKNTPEEKYIGIHKKKLKIKLFQKEELVKQFPKEDFRLKHFSSALIFLKPRWGDFTPLSPTEKIRKFCDRHLQKIFSIKNLGGVYFFVFEKT